MEKIREFVNRAIEFFKDIEIEAKRVTWPPLNETVRSTGAVMLISAILTSFIALVDFLFSMAVKYLLG